jgi:hypothetical protein
MFLKHVGKPLRNYTILQVREAQSKFREKLTYTNRKPHFIGKFLYNIIFLSAPTSTKWSVTLMF